MTRGNSYYHVLLIWWNYIGIIVLIITSKMWKVNRSCVELFSVEIQFSFSRLLILAAVASVSPDIIPARSFLVAVTFRIAVENVHLVGRRYTRRNVEVIGTRISLQTRKFFTFFNLSYLLFPRICFIRFFGSDGRASSWLR